MRFADITGQEDLKRHLVQSVDAGRVSHAQLFTGQAGAGALALAVAYVQYLCCHHRHDGDSCGECPDCRQIAALAHPDLHLVFPVNKQGKKSGEVMRSDEFLPLFRAIFGENGGYFSAQDWYERLDLGKTLKGMIAAREADEIIRKLSFKSFEADYKTMLIWLPEAMNEEAANKILKILEEPWEKTLFLLVSEHGKRRAACIHFADLKGADGGNYLQKHGYKHRGSYGKRRAHTYNVGAAVKKLRDCRKHKESGNYKRRSAETACQQVVYGFHHNAGLVPAAREKAYDQKYCRNYEYIRYYLRPKRAAALTVLAVFLCVGAFSAVLSIACGRGGLFACRRLAAAFLLSHCDISFPPSVVNADCLTCSVRGRADIILSPTGIIITANDKNSL